MNVPLIKRDSAVYSKTEYNGPEIVKGKLVSQIDFAMGNIFLNIFFRPPSPA